MTLLKTSELDVNLCINCEQKSVDLYLLVAYSNVGGTVETITKTRLHAHSLNPLHIRWRSSLSPFS